MLKRITNWMQEHWKLSLILFGVFVLVFIIFGTISTRNANNGNNNQQESTTPPSSNVGSNNNTADSIIMRKQPDLIKEYGSLPDGYLWDLDGTLLSQGVKSMSAEEVVYAYINGIRSLDFSMAQKYSRGSRVVETYSGYFDSKNPNTDYYDSFLRNMYKQALLSIQVLGIESSSIFAENKQVFTVKVQMLDLSDKDFWVEDKYDIYNTLQIYTSSDSTQAELFLYDYILGYYKQQDAATREVTFDLTLEKYVDLDTGWLVSIDTDIDSACKYSNGTPVIRYIREMYASEGREYLKSHNNATPVTPSAPVTSPTTDNKEGNHSSTSDPDEPVYVEPIEPSYNDIG